MKLDKKKIKDKLIYLSSLFAMCALLVLVAYFGFLKTTNIDVTDNIEIVYMGENGNASAAVETNYTNLNQRMSDFMKTVRYQVTPDENLSNGDTIMVKSTYDHALANQYHFNPIHTSKAVIVEGLPSRYTFSTEIPIDFLEEANVSMDEWLENHGETIFETETRMDYPDNVVMEDEVLYSAFLKANETSSSDKLVSLFHLIYKTPDEEIASFYYIVCIPNINTSDSIDSNSIYGERAYLSEDEANKQEWGSYIQSIYDEKYKVETLYQKEKDLPAEPEEENTEHQSEDSKQEEEPENPKSNEE